MPPSGPYGPSGSSGRMTTGHDREAHTGSKLQVVDPLHERVQPGFLDEQQSLEGDDRAGKSKGPGPGEQPRGKDNQGSDLGRRVDILAAGCDVCGRDDRDGSREENGCRRRQPGLPQPSAEPGECPEHREGPNAGETGARPFGMPGPLTLDANGGAAQRGNQEIPRMSDAVMAAKVDGRVSSDRHAGRQQSEQAPIHGSTLEHRNMWWSDVPRTSCIPHGRKIDPEEGRGIPHIMTRNYPVRVLVVDDELLIRWSIAETLKEHGHTVLEAENGAAALRELQRSSPPSMSCCSTTGCRMCRTSPCFFRSARSRR